MEDVTGQLPSLEDVERAKSAVMCILGPTWMLKLPPQAAVEMPNVLRCLRVAEAVIRAKADHDKQ